MSRASTLSPKSAPPAPAASPFPMILSCFVSVLAPSLAALPGDSMWAPIFTAVLAFAGGWQLSASRKTIGTAPIGLPNLLSLLVVAFASLSLLAQWLMVSHGRPHYMDAMLNGLSVWIALWSLLAAASAQAKNRVLLYSFTLALIVGASLAAGQGVTNYLLLVKAGTPMAREFGTSTPDFFAGFLVMSIPITLALFLGAPGGQGRVMWMLYGIAFLVQVAVLPTTGSRFGLIAFVLSLIVFAAGLFSASRHGLKFETATRGRLIALSILVVLFAGLAARPILHRLQGAQVKDQANSAAFRVWTWKGAAKYALANPVLGTGPGTFVYRYPKYAYVGFTRHAHNAYLQVADELGTPALLILLALFGTTLTAGWRRLSASEDTEPSPRHAALTADAEEFLSQAAPTDDRYLLCGLIAGVGGGLVQNLVDSDFYVFFNGVMLWGMLGLILALSRKPETRVTPPTWTAPLGAIVCLAVAVLSVFNGLSGFALQNQDYVQAASLNPLDPQSQRMLGVRYYPAQGDMAATETALSASANLAPDSPSYTRIGDFDKAQGRLTDAVAAYRTGLRYEPQSITLLLDLADLQAQLGRRPESLAAYRTLAAQETAPYGQDPALGDVPEVRYAFADQALGDDALAHGNASDAIARYLHAKHVVEDYLAPGGASNGMRLVMTGGEPDLALDARLRELYTRVTDALARVYQSQGKIQDSEAVKRDVANHISQFSGTLTPANP